MRLRLSLLVGFFLIFLSACSGQNSPQDASQGLYKPPTLVPTNVPTWSADQVVVPTDWQGEQKPTPTPLCADNLMFLDDLTIPDGSLVKPGDRLDKRWKVQNNGTCNWDERYRLKLIAGPGMGVPVQQALAPALSGSDTVIRMVFIAPEEPGNYRSAWQAYDPQDQPFGDPFFIDIVVEDPNLGGEDD